MTDRTPTGDSHIGRADVVCRTPTCKWNGISRTVERLEVGPDVLATPQLICAVCLRPIPDVTTPRPPAPEVR